MHEPDSSCLAVALLLSSHAERARSYLISTMRETDSVLVVTVLRGSDHVSLAPSLFFNEAEREALDAYVQRQRDIAEKLLVDSLALFAARGLRASACVLAGEPKTAIIDKAAEVNSDIIVLGSRGLGALSRLVLGSVSSHVLHHARRSVLIVKETALLEPEAPRARSALVALDDTSHSRAALQLAVDVCATGDSVLLLSVHVPFIGLHDDLAAVMGETNTRNVWCAEALKKLESSYQPQVEAAGLVCSTLFRQGDARSIICEEAENAHVDLLVLGARGAGALERWLVGSVSSYCTEHARVPAVLVVRQA